jgi:hypothetical protein
MDSFILQSRASVDKAGSVVPERGPKGMRNFKDYGLRRGWSTEPAVTRTGMPKLRDLGHEVVQEGPEIVVVAVAQFVLD